MLLGNPTSTFVWSILRPLATPNPLRLADDGVVFQLQMYQMWIFGFDRGTVGWGYVGQSESCFRAGSWDELAWTPGLWSQRGNWEQTGDESGALLMGAFCQWGGGADMSVGGSRRTDAPPLQGGETRHSFPDGGIEKFVCSASKTDSSSSSTPFCPLIGMILSFSLVERLLFSSVNQLRPLCWWGKRNCWDERIHSIQVFLSFFQKLLWA